MFLFIFIAKYTCGKYVFIAALEIICSKTYSSLLYESFKTEVPKITQKWDWTKCFWYNSPLVIKSQIFWINLYALKYKHIRVIIKKNPSS